MGQDPPDSAEASLEALREIRRELSDLEAIFYGFFLAYAKAEINRLSGLSPKVPWENYVMALLAKKERS